MGRTSFTLGAGQHIDPPIPHYLHGTVYFLYDYRGAIK